MGIVVGRFFTIRSFRLYICYKHCPSSTRFQQVDQGDELTKI